MKKKEYKRGCITAEDVIHEVGLSATKDDIFQYLKRHSSYRHWSLIELADETDRVTEILEKTDLLMIFPNREDLI